MAIYWIWPGGFLRYSNSMLYHLPVSTNPWILGQGHQRALHFGQRYPCGSRIYQWCSGRLHHSAASAPIMASSNHPSAKGYLGTHCSCGRMTRTEIYRLVSSPAVDSFASSALSALLFYPACRILMLHGIMRTLQFGQRLNRPWGLSLLAYLRCVLLLPRSGEAPTARQP